MGTTMAMTSTSVMSPARLSVLGGSDREFSEIIDAIRRELSPRGLIEALLVDQLVSAVSRLRALLGVERGPMGALDEIAAAEDSLYRALTELDRRRSRDASAWGRPADVSTRIGDVAGLPPLPCEDDPSILDDGPDVEEYEPTDASTSPDETPWRSRLVFDENVSDTSPVVRGTWVTAGQIVSLIVDGWTWDDILRNYPELTERDIRACLAYTVEQDGPITL